MKMVFFHQIIKFTIQGKKLFKPYLDQEQRKNKLKQKINSVLPEK